MKFYMALRDGTFEKAEGHLLSEDIVAHKVKPGDWRLSDIASGAMIKAGLKSLKECKEAFATMPESIKENILKARESEGYKKLCRQAEAYAKEFGL